MLRATKYLDLKTCVLRLAAVALAHLSRAGALPLPELEERVLGEAGEDARVNLVPALNLLFVLGCVDYDEDADAIVLLGWEAPAR